MVKPNEMSEVAVRTHAIIVRSWASRVRSSASFVAAGRSVPVVMGLSLSLAAKPGFSWNGRSQRGSGRAALDGFDLALLGVLQILLEEVVQERPDHRDGPEHPHVLPRRRNHAADDVGGQLELETQQQPHAKPPPDRFAFSVRG